MANEYQMYDGQWLPWRLPPEEMSMGEFAWLTRGTAIQPQVWRAFPGQIYVDAWLDHMVGDDIVWGLHYRQITANPVNEGAMAYIAAKPRIHLPRQDLGPRFDFTPPVGGPHHYFTDIGVATLPATPRPGTNDLPAFTPTSSVEYHYDAVMDASTGDLSPALSLYGYTTEAPGVAYQSADDLLGNVRGPLAIYEDNYENVTREDFFR